MLKLKIIQSSTRQQRASDQVTPWVVEEVKKFGQFNFELLDLRDYQLPYYDDPMPASMLSQPYSPDIRKKWAQKIDEADAFLIITPEYNRGYPAVLKSALDAVYREWNNKAVSFVSYGGYANGARSVEQLRQVVIELQMAPIREGVHIGLFTGQPVFDDNGKMLIDSHTKKLSVVLSQLHWWAEALHTARNK